MNSISQLKNVNNQIAKLKKAFYNGKGQMIVQHHEGFTIDLYYGGNKEVDVHRINIGSIPNGEKDGKEFIEFLIKQLIGNREFWLNFCEIDKANLESVIKETYELKNKK